MLHGIFCIAITYVSIRWLGGSIAVYDHYSFIFFFYINLLITLIYYSDVKNKIAFIINDPA